MTVAAKVREVVLDFQQIVSTRNDLGTLASMHNKLVRLALFRLPASIKEILGELPDKLRQAQADALRPDPDEQRRVFVPTRPTLLLQGERVQLSAVAPGQTRVAELSLFTRVGGRHERVRKRMQRMGRSTYTSDLGPFDKSAQWVDYYVQADFQPSTRSGKTTAPNEAPHFTYTLTLI